VPFPPVAIAQSAATKRASRRSCQQGRKSLYAAAPQMALPCRQVAFAGSENSGSCRRKVGSPPAECSRPFVIGRLFKERPTAENVRVRYRQKKVCSREDRIYATCSVSRLPRTAERNMRSQHVAHPGQPRVQPARPAAIRIHRVYESAQNASANARVQRKAKSSQQHHTAP